MKLKELIDMKCRKCNGTSLFFYKYAYVDSFHYCVWCQNCNAKYKVERNKEIYEVVKNMPWVRSANALKRDLGLDKSSAKSYQKRLLFALRKQFYVPGTETSTASS